MARFRVELVQTVVETAVVWIEANNEAEAEEAALDQVTVGNGAEWRFKDALGDIEVLDIKQIAETTHD
jgi:hypothetical protein